MPSEKREPVGGPRRAMTGATVTRDGLLLQGTSDPKNRKRSITFRRSPNLHGAVVSNDPAPANAVSPMAGNGSHSLGA